MVPAGRLPQHDLLTGDGDLAQAVRRGHSADGAATIVIADCVATCAAVGVDGRLAYLRIGRLRALRCEVQNMTLAHSTIVDGKRLQRPGAGMRTIIIACCINPRPGTIALSMQRCA